MEIKELHQKLSACLNTVKLGVAGRMLYYNEEVNTFTLAMHSTSPEETLEVTQLAWDSIPEELKTELQGIGFAGKQI